MSEFHRVATIDQISEGRGIAVEVEGRRIAVFNVEGEFLAVEAGCARHQAPLEKGAVEEGVLHCPWHGVSFDLESGVCMAFPDEVSGAPIPTRIEGNNVLVET